MDTNIILAIFELPHFGLITEGQPEAFAGGNSFSNAYSKRNAMKSNYTEEQVAKIYSEWFDKKQMLGINHNDFLPLLIRCANRYFGIDEIWKDVHGYESMYQVSNFGRIRGLDRITKCKNGHDMPIHGRILRTTDDGHGYPSASLKRNNKRKQIKIYRIVAILFIENTYNKPTVNHKSGVRANGFIFNLEWMTYGENNQHSYDSLGRIGARTGVYGSDNPSSKPVLQYSITGKFIRKYDSQVLASEATGIGFGSISASCRGTRRTAGGYVFEFKNSEQYPKND